MGYCCADCVYMDINDENDYGDFWCGNHRKYYPGSDNPCSSFRARNSSSGDSSGGCYITSAVCVSLNKPDNCYELNAFRNFRDNWLKTVPEGKQLLEEYYSLAPNIVSAIDKLSNAKEIYKSIWQQYLSKCLNLIEQGQNRECKKLYETMMMNLKNTYLDI